MNGARVASYLISLLVGLCAAVVAGLPVEAAPAPYNRISVDNTIARTPTSHREVESVRESIVMLDVAGATIESLAANTFSAERLLNLTDASDAGVALDLRASIAPNNCAGAAPCPDLLSVNEGYVTLADANALFRPKGLLAPGGQFFVTAGAVPGRAEGADAQVSLEAMVAQGATLALADMDGEYRLAVYTQQLERDVIGETRESAGVNNIELAFNGDGSCAAQSLGNATASHITGWPGVGLRSFVTAFAQQPEAFFGCSYTVASATGTVAVALEVFDGGDSSTLVVPLFVSADHRYLVGRSVVERDEGISSGAELSMIVGVRTGSITPANADLAGVYFLSTIGELISGAEEFGIDGDFVSRSALALIDDDPDGAGFSSCSVLGSASAGVVRTLGGTVPIAQPATVTASSEGVEAISGCRYRVDSSSQVTLELTTSGGSSLVALGLSDDRQTLVGAAMQTSEDPLDTGIDLELLLPASARIETVLMQRFSGLADAPEVTDFVAPVVPGEDPNVVILASVLPGSRSVQVNQDATAFASVINAGSQAALNCDIRHSGPEALSLSYQQTDPASNVPVGEPDQGISIPAGAAQTFVFRIRPLAEFSAVEVGLDFSCLNSEIATRFEGLNTLLLSATADPGPDLIALGATVLNDGIAHLDAATGSGFFSIASFNVGSADDMSVSVDTGNTELPLIATICETNPATGVCVNPAVPSSEAVAVTIEAAGTPTFAVFVGASQDIPLDPANRRVFVRFADSSGVVRGSTSVAVQTD